MSERTVSFLRWIALLPGALLFALATHFPIHWLAMFVHRMWESEGESFMGRLTSAETLERLGVAFCTPMALIVAAAWIAPSLKMRAAVVFATFAGVLCVASFVYLLLALHPAASDVVRNVLVVLLNGVGICFGLNKAKVISELP